MRGGMTRLFQTLGLAALIVASGGLGVREAQAAPDPCEKIENWHLYNQCLAKQGPRRGQRAARISGGGDPEKTVPSGAGPGRRYGRRAASPGGSFVQRKGNGRMSVSFDILGPTAGQVKRR